jgi:murein DD-endopeptidase MepM/ murein hydrolase activator NlpD
MDPKPCTRQMIIFGIAILFLAVLACSVTDQPAVQTAVAQAGQTALAAGQQAALTEAAHLIETAKVAGPTEAAQLIQTAQAAGATAAFSALETIIAGTSQLGSGGYPMFYAPVSGTGLTTSSGSDKHTGPDQYAVDYSMPTEGAPVYPTLAGIIVYSGCDDQDYGCAVVIRHQNPSWNTIYYSIYAHLQTGSLAADGTVVDGNNPIGSMGQTGTGGAGSGIHLHFAVRTSNQVEQGLTALYGDNMTAFDFRPYMP